MECWRVNWKDYYDILGVRINSEPEVIKGAYNALARKHHPDVNPSGAHRMTQVNEAYEILSNPLRKADYDVAYRERWQSRYGGGRQDSGSSREDSGARQEDSGAGTGSQQGSGADAGTDTGPGPSPAGGRSGTAQEEAQEPERAGRGEGGGGIWRSVSSAWRRVYGHYSMRPRHHDYREKFIPWPSLGWQQAALICSIPLGLVLAIKAPLFWFQAGGGALFVAGSYACIATHCISYVDKANALARFLGTVVVIVMLLAIGAAMLALALGLIAVVTAALLLWFLGSRAMKND